MQINERVEEILQDLYRIDPTFKSEEVKLKKLLVQLLSVRPNVSLDEEFVAGLRRQLLAMAGEMADRKPEKRSWFNSFSLRWAGSLALLVVAVGVAVYFAAGDRLKPGGQEAADLLASKVEIQPLGASAFGSLRDVQLASATGRGGGGGGAETLSNKDASSPVPMGMGGGGFAPDLITYKYVYKGEDFEIPASQMDVYRREKGLPNGLDAASILKNLDFGLLNAGAFGDVKVETLNLVEDREFGYSIYLSLQDGIITIGQNWAKWPTLEKLCLGRADDCYRQNQMKIGDIPEDSVLIGLANDFLAQHNISTENYGEPFVNNFWKDEYNRAADKSMVYIPDVLNVVYPLQLNGNDVYDESGNKIGLNVTVDARNRRAAGLMDLATQRYQSSSYDTVTDKEELISIAEKGGYHGGYYETQGGRTVEVELGTPNLDYLKLWQYEAGVTKELLVPAMIFPINNFDQHQSLYRRGVVVPLIRDIISQDESRKNPINILPAAVQ